MISVGKRNRGPAGVALAVVLTFEAAGIAWIVAAERTAQRADESRISVFQRAGTAWRPALVDVPPGTETPRQGARRGHDHGNQLVEPIVRPPSMAANEAPLRPDEMVIGIVVGGKAHAYRFAGFESKSGHLVNDVVGGVPVSVAYCDITECLRVYSDPQGSTPLDLKVAGVLNGEMIVRHGERMYYHKSGRKVEPGDDASTFNYAIITPAVTTWKEWKNKHPDTRVYVGR